MERMGSKEMQKTSPPENKYCVTKKLNSSNPTLLVTTFEKAFCRELSPQVSSKHKEAGENKKW